jgi:hypothetical protein
MHISNALIWGLENDSLPPDNSLIIVMWSGNDRDDYILPKSAIKPETNTRFLYTANVMSGVTGGSHENAKTNTTLREPLITITNAKSQESRAIENYLIITKTWHYLTNKGYNFVFLNFLDSNLPSRTKHFDIKTYLPKLLCRKLDSMMLNIIDPYTWCINNNLLADDNYHPNPDGHLTWTREILLPKLRSIFQPTATRSLENIKNKIYTKIQENFKYDKS